MEADEHATLDYFEQFGDPELDEDDHEEDSGEALRYGKKGEKSLAQRCVPRRHLATLFDLPLAKRCSFRKCLTSDDCPKKQRCVLDVCPRPKPVYPEDLKPVYPEDPKPSP